MVSGADIAMLKKKSRRGGPFIRVSTTGLGWGPERCTTNSANRVPHQIDCDPILIYTTAFLPGSGPSDGQFDRRVPLPFQVSLILALRIILESSTFDIPDVCRSGLP